MIQNTADMIYNKNEKNNKHERTNYFFMNVTILKSDGLTDRLIEYTELYFDGAIKKIETL